jgi:hypothetical protein
MILGYTSDIRKISQFSRLPVVSKISRRGIAFCLFLSHSLRVLSRNETYQGLVEEASEPDFLFSTIFCYCYNTLLFPPRACELLLSSRGLIAINWGVVGFGFVAIASEIHASTQCRCLTGAYACKRVGSVVASTLDWSICACFFAV